MKPKFIENTTLHERQMRYYNGHQCPYCNSMCDFVDSKAVHQESHGMIYLCHSCQAWVGVHHGNTDQAYGFVAKKALRDLRHLAHQMFDPLWERKMSYDLSKRQAQVKARKWLADFLKIDVIECHIGMFDEDLCKRTIEECKKHHKTEEEILRIKQETEVKKNMITFLADSMDITLQQWNLMTGTLFCFEKNGKKFHYKLRDHAGHWEGKGTKFKPLTVDIDEFLNKHFGSC